MNVNGQRKTAEEVSVENYQKVAHCVRCAAQGTSAQQAAAIAPLVPKATLLFVAAHPVLRALQERYPQQTKAHATIVAQDKSPLQARHHAVFARQGKCLIPVQLFV